MNSNPIIMFLFIFSVYPFIASCMKNAIKIEITEINNPIITPHVVLRILPNFSLDFLAFSLFISRIFSISESKYILRSLFSVFK